MKGCNIQKLHVNGGPSHLSSVVGASRSAACAGGGMSERGQRFGTVHGESGLVQLGLWGKWKKNRVILAKRRRLRVVHV